MLPQIIYIALMATSFFLNLKDHGKPKKGKDNIWKVIISMAIINSLLYWGGFFDNVK